jgi:hypothetical protein
MKETATAVMALVLCTLLAATNALAQGLRWRGSEGWGQGSRYGRLYDARTVETNSGEVMSIEQMTPSKGMGRGVHLTLKTDKEMIAVHLGPAWYVEHQDIKLAPTDKIEVRGSRVTFQGKPAIIAAEVRKGDGVLVLRDANGIPMWAGWRRNQ